MEMDFIHAPMGGERNYVVGVVIFPTLINFFFYSGTLTQLSHSLKKVSILQLQHFMLLTLRNIYAENADFK